MDYRLASFRFACVLLALCLALLLAACGSIVEPRALCYGRELGNAADTTGTRALGTVWNAVYCDATHTDTVRNGAFP